MNLRHVSVLNAYATVFAIGLGTCGAYAQEKLRVATEGAYPPFNFVDSSGAIGGFDVEITGALCAKMGVECEIVTQDWDGIIPGLLAEKYDVIAASMFITEERKQQVAFSDPYYVAAMTAVVSKDAGIADLSPEGLSGKVIGVQSGTTQATYATAVYKDSEIREYPTQDEVNLDLASGRLDLQIGDLVPMLEWITKAEDAACCELAGDPITDPAFVGEGVGMAVRKEDTELLANLNAALKAIREDRHLQVHQ